MAAEGSDEDSQDPATTARLVEVLAQAPVLFDRLHTTAQAGASPGSEAAKDASAPLGHHGQIMAIDHLSCGVEHLVVWRRLLLAGVQPYAAHMTLVRGAMEGAVTCRWLIDPRADSADRIRRGVALLLEDYGNRRDFERDIGIAADAIKPPAKSAADRYTELRAARTANKIGATQVPKMTALFGGYAGLQAGHGRAIYRLLSAYAHGKQWKGLTTANEVVEDAIAVPGGQLMKVTANDDWSVRMTLFGVRAAAAAVGELETYYGADRLSSIGSAGLGESDR